MDFTLWDLKEEFTVDEAACLWFEVDPYNRRGAPCDIQSKVKTIYNVLEEARRGGKIEQTTPTGPNAWMAMPFTPKLSRQGLKNYAGDKGLTPLFLFPEEREKIGAETSGPSLEGKDPSSKNEQVFKHSDDFRSVNLRGEQFTLTPQQAQAVEILHQAYLNDTPDLSQESILDRIGTTSTRLSDTFRSDQKIWKTLIAQGAKRGTFRLNI